MNEMRELQEAMAEAEVGEDYSCIETVFNLRQALLKTQMHLASRNKVIEGLRSLIGKTDDDNLSELQDNAEILVRTLPDIDESMQEIENECKNISVPRSSVERRLNAIREQEQE